MFTTSLTLGHGRGLVNLTFITVPDR
jgi:hypothetical protein